MNDPQELYHRLGRLLENVPPIGQPGHSRDTEALQWIGRAEAALKAVSDIPLSAELTSTIGRLQTADYQRAADAIIGILHRALALVELRMPPGTAGTFICAFSDIPKCRQACL